MYTKLEAAYKVSAIDCPLFCRSQLGAIFSVELKVIQSTLLAWLKSVRKSTPHKKTKRTAQDESGSLARRLTTKMVLLAANCQVTTLPAEQCSFHWNVGIIMLLTAD